MASEKKPSIYDDRSTIGSSDELDEYGVWVKIEPQDFGAEEAEIPDSSFPDIGGLPDFDTDLIPAGTEGDDPFPDENPSGDASDGDNSLKEDAFTINELEFPDLDFSGDDFGTDAFSENGEKEPAFEPENLPEAEKNDPFGTEDINLPFGDFVGTAGDDLPADSPEAAETLPEFPGEKEKSKNSGDVPGKRAEKPASPGETSPAADLSTRLLMKIADELSSIRNELSNLKQEFRVLRRGEGSAPEPAEEGGHGFFGEEEDDEKISLTGDELDTILSTTDFEGEPSQDAAPEEPEAPEKAEDLPAEDFPLLEEPPAGGELFSEEPAPVEDADEPPAREEAPAPESPPEETDDFVFDEDAISLDDISIDLDLNLDAPSLEALNDADKTLQEDAETAEIPFPDTGEFELLPEETGEAAESLPEPEAEELNLDPSEAGELQMLVEKGLEPMTPPPDDTSYLEEDPLAADLLAEPSLDLSGAVIDEPDLSVEIPEEPPEEPDLEHISLDELSMDELTEDIAVHLDMEEMETETESPLSPENEEIVMDIPTEEEKTEEADFSPVIPEGFGGEAEDAAVSLDEEDLEEGINLLEDTAAEPPEDDGSGTEENILEGEDIKEGDQEGETNSSALPSHLQQELKTVLSYMDQLLESLPEEKIEEFAKSEYFDTYKKLFKELGLA